ncbi:ABC transporter substrate-binding protein [Rhizobium binxianense]
MFKRRLLHTTFLIATLAGASSALAASELRIGLRDDAGSLDPATNATFVGRVSMQSICDKLVDIDVDGNLQPMLATKWDWSADGTVLTLTLRQGVKFQDGTDMDAEAVKFNLDRYLTMKGSRRRAELQVIKTVEVVDPSTVKITLSQPSVSLLTQMTDRAGMIVSPTAYKKTTPEEFAKAPVCAGPYKVVEYKPQDRIVLEKFPGHWRADQYHFDRLIYFALSDTNVRLLNLKAGDLDLAENIAPVDVPSLQGDPNIRTAVGEQPAYREVVFNLNGPHANPDIAKNAAVRQAFSLAIDRNAINQVVFGGGYTAGNQAFIPGTFWYDADYPVKPGDPEAAKAKLAEAGVSNVTLDLMISTAPEEQAVAETMQSMLAAAGITLNILPTEYVTLRDKTHNGEFQAYTVGSSGRVDPDLNLSLDYQCGQANNVGGYCNPELDKLFGEGRATPDQNERKKIYSKITDILMRDLPNVYIYNPTPTYAFKASIEGFKPYPDGIIRLEGVTMK